MLTILNRFPLPRLPLRRFPVKLAATLAIALVIGLAISLIDLSPDYSHLQGQFYSGTQQGQYFAVVDKLVAGASKAGGKLENIATGGSVDNLHKLATATSGCRARFAIVQDGIPAPPNAELHLLGRLRKSESVFFVGKEAATFTRFEQLRGLTIGVGPKNSGTEHLARSILEAREFKHLGMKLRAYPVAEQLALLQSGTLPLGVFVVDEDSKLIGKAIIDRGLQMAAFAHLDVIAKRLPFVTMGRIAAGQFDAVRVIPATDRAVLRVNTLIVGNSCSDHAERVALLSLLSQEFPGFINHNRTSPPNELFPLTDTSQRYFEQGGAGFFDLHVPWLVSIMPLGNWVYVAMIISIFVNLTTLWHRFRLWRIDANTDKLDQIIRDVVGSAHTPVELMELEPTADSTTPEALAKIDSALAALDQLRKKCRTQANSLLVPMGSEWIYRYSEQQIEETLTAMRRYRSRARNRSVPGENAESNDPPLGREPPIVDN